MIKICFLIIFATYESQTIGFVQKAGIVVENVIFMWVTLCLFSKKINDIPFIPLI